MLGLLMMSVPLGFAVGLSAVALVRAEPDGSAGEDEEDIRHEGGRIVDDGQPATLTRLALRSRYGRRTSGQEVRATHQQIKEVP